MRAETTIRVYKCPTCNGALRFSTQAHALHCMWCGNTYDVADASVHQMRLTTQGYLCPECGARLMTEEFVAATTCPYCGNNEITPHRFGGAFEPDLIIPFSVSRQQAIQSYQKTVAQRRYLPNDYEDKAQIVSVEGAYVPFWLQSGTVSFDFTYVGIYKKDNRNYVSNHRRMGTYEFARVPADASDRMPDDIMDSIEPYNYEELVPYDPGYLPGFMAERYTVAADEVNRRVNVRVANSACSAAMSTLDSMYDTRYPDHDRYHATVARSRIEQVLLPVWLVVVLYREEKYVVGVNGQTGKVAVNLPIDKGKRRAAVLWESLKSAAWVLSIELGFVLLIFVIGVGAVGLDGMLDRARALFDGSTWAQASGKDIALAAFTVVFLICLIVGPVVEACLRGRRKVIDSMHNVKKATNADAFDICGLNVTLSEFGQGPQ